MLAKMFKERRNVLLRRQQQHTVSVFKEFREGIQVSAVGLAGERAQPFFYAQIGLVVLQQHEIAGGVHCFDYPRLLAALRMCDAVTEPASTRNQHRQYEEHVSENIDANVSRASLTSNFTKGFLNETLNETLMCKIGRYGRE